MLLQYASDLHITDYPRGTPFETFLIPCAPVLILAGDICSAYDPLFYQFLAWCSEHWEIVLFVPGNHEYYCKTAKPASIAQTDLYISSLALVFPNVIVLQNGASYLLPGTHIRIVGTTLWSQVDSAIWDEVAAKKGEYAHTYTDTAYGLRKTHPADLCALHAYHVACLASTLAIPWSPDERVVVVTHYIPTHALLEPEYQGDRWASCYASHDDALLYGPTLAYWICGHGHRATMQQRSPGGPWLCMNARGYNRPEEQRRTRDVYSPTACIYV